MAAIHDLLRQITDDNLRERLTEEIKKLEQKKKFGLVFEEHLPECAPLYQLPIRIGSNVAKKAGRITDIYTVLEMDGKEAVCQHLSAGTPVRMPLQELVMVAKFGDAIFPSLESLGKVKNAPDSSLWHTLIEADNFHALQLLEYLYPQKVDCIYIDPPYNTGARDWKYNNDYVDGSDAYRHSKWLSMMQKRLELAKKILNPEDSVLIVTIDEKEHLYLGCLINELFSDARCIQEISTVINSSGSDRKDRFSRTHEYIYFIMYGNAQPSELLLEDEWRGNIRAEKKNSLYWNQLMRSGSSPLRINHPLTFYPIYIAEDGSKIVEIGDPIPRDMNRNDVPPKKGAITIWPIRSNGEEGRWQIGTDKLKAALKKGYVKLGKLTERGISITYLAKGEQEKIETGKFSIVGHRKDGSVIEDTNSNIGAMIPNTTWDIPLHNATYFGSQLINNIFGNSRFTFPKSIYAVHDTIRFFVEKKPSALIVDFFAGSGTTLNAVNLLNSEDGGNRRCILVTNNEVSGDEAKKLSDLGHKPGDEAWENWGIARYVTWPRTKYTILGKRDDGAKLTGDYFTYLKETIEKPRNFYQIGFCSELSKREKKQLLAVLRDKKGKSQLPQSLVTDDTQYIVSEKYTASILFSGNAMDEWLSALEEQEHIIDFYICVSDAKLFQTIKQRVNEILGLISVEEPVKRPMSEGFPANVEYFKLGFLDKDSVSLGAQFREILPLLWLKAGAVGERPELEGEDEPPILVLPKNDFAVLLAETYFPQFLTEMENVGEIHTIYFVTDSEDVFRSMSAHFGQANTYQLYRDYIDNFVLGTRNRGSEA